MSNWNNFRKQHKNMGYTIEQLSEMYGGGLADIKKKTINLAKNISKHTDDLINLAKQANEIYNGMHNTDEKGNKTLKKMSLDDISNHVDKIKKLANSANKIASNIKDTHNNLSI